MGVSWGKGLVWVRGLDLLSILLKTIAISLPLAYPRTTQQILSPPSFIPSCSQEPGVVSRSSYTRLLLREGHLKPRVTTYSVTGSRAGWLPEKAGRE